MKDMKFDNTITFGNLLTMFGMVAAILMFVFSIHFTTNANRSDILALKQSVESTQVEMRQSIADLQRTVNSIDKRLAVVEERTAR
jgi:type VI protein secretion system component VasK